MDHLKPDFLLNHSSDEFSRNLESALKNEKYISHKTLYRMWIRLYYSLERQGGAQVIIPFVNQSIWADFIYQLLNTRDNSQNLISSLKEFQSKQFFEAEALLIAETLHGATQDSELASSLYWKLSDLYANQHSIEAAYALGKIYAGSHKPELYKNSNLFIKNISSSISCFEYASSSRKRDAYRELSSIFFAQGLHAQANEYLNSAINAGDSIALELHKSREIISIEIQDEPVIEVMAESEPDASIEQKPDDIAAVVQPKEEQITIPKSPLISKLQDIKFVVIDFETTDKSPSLGARIIEIGYVEVIGGKIKRQYSTLVNHQSKTRNKAEWLNGIPSKSIRGAPVAAVEIPKLVDVIRGSILVAHNITFEMSFLKSECDHLNIENPFQSISTLCTLRRARRLFPSLPNHKLGTIIDHLGITMDGPAHRALPDAKVTALMLLKMIELDPQGVLEGIQSVI